MDTVIYAEIVTYLYALDLDRYSCLSVWILQK